MEIVDKINADILYNYCTKGLTQKEVAETISKKYVKYYSSTDVSKIVRKYGFNKNSTGYGHNTDRGKYPGYSYAAWLEFVLGKQLKKDSPMCSNSIQNKYPPMHDNCF